MRLIHFLLVFGFFEKIFFLVLCFFNERLLIQERSLLRLFLLFLSGNFTLVFDECCLQSRQALRLKREAVRHGRNGLHNRSAL